MTLLFLSLFLYIVLMFSKNHTYHMMDSLTSLEPYLHIDPEKMCSSLLFFLFFMNSYIFFFKFL